LTIIVTTVKADTVIKVISVKELKTHFITTILTVILAILQDI
jgi:hypothetical protein